MYVELKNINKTYGDYKASDNVSFGIEKGKLIGLLGPSGSGKTTILRMIAGLEQPDSGEIIIDGRVVNDVPASERGIGFVFQNYALFRYMTVYDNIAFGLKVQKADKKYIKQRVMELVELIGLKGLEKRYPSQLSGGQRQRVAFARALAPNPQLLLLDEPFAAIDAKIRTELRSWLKDMIEKLGITSIFVTHDQDEALSMSDIIAVMRSGHIEQIGSPWEIYFRPANRFVADFVGTVNFLTARIVSAEGGTVAADHNGMLLQIPTEVPVEPGETVTLVVRPECIRLAEPGESVPEGKSLEGQIENYSFLGRIIRYWVRVGEEQFIIDDANVDLSGARSGAVQLCLDTRKLHILKDGGSHDT